MGYQAVVFIGPPGSGKGTQGQALGTLPGFYHCASGDMFRQLDSNSEMGRIVHDYYSRGELVPDDVTVKMWHAHIRNMQASGTFQSESELLILDGIPRNESQAEMMESEIDVQKVILLACEDEEAMLARMRGRALKENRADDAQESVIRHRWDVYQKETAPVLNYYDKELIAQVNALQTPAEVMRNILDILIPIQNNHFRHRSNEAGEPAQTA